MLRVILAAAVCAVVVLNIVSSTGPISCSSTSRLFGGGGCGWRSARRPLVSPTGIHRPWRGTRFLSWEEVDFVDAPLAGVYGTKLTLRSGKVVVLDDVPAAESGAVAALGQKQVKAAPRAPRARARAA